MKLLVEFLICGLLSLIAYQDYRYRAVSWILFPLLAVLFGVLTFICGNAFLLVIYTLTNLVFLSLNMAILALYFIFRKVTIRSLFTVYLGIGDLLFFCCLCFLFNPKRYILFYLVSLILAAIAFSLIRLVKKKTSIPLAGFQSIVLICLFLVQLCDSQVNLFYS